MAAGLILLRPRTRSAFRDACSDYGVVRQIGQTFADEGLVPASDEHVPPGGWDRAGQRRGVFDRYTALVDWADWNQVRPVVAAFEQILSWITVHEQRDRLCAALERDGYRVDTAGRIRSSPAATLAELPLSGLRDPAAITEHLPRMAEAADADPPQAISSAKALVEATTKTVLVELNEPFDEREDLPALARLAQKALGAHPDTLAPTVKGAETSKRLLANLAQVVTGLAELRNAYGPDHGRSTPTSGLGPRHAHLAVGAATTYCRFLLETLEARRHTVGWTSSSTTRSCTTTADLRAPPLGRQR